MGDAIYESLWYHLPNELQKDICYIIQHLQSGPIATMGPFGIISFGTINTVRRDLTIHLNADLGSNFTFSLDESIG